MFQIVGQTEADVKSGKVSITSPTGRALIGKKPGDSVEVSTPGGGKSYEILNVAFIYARCGSAVRPRPARRAKRRFPP